MTNKLTITLRQLILVYFSQNPERSRKEQDEILFDEPWIHDQ